METTFRKKIKFTELDYIFNNCSEKSSIRFFELVDVIPENEFDEKTAYIYKIKVRHSEDEKGKTLFNTVLKDLRKNNPYLLSTEFIEKIVNKNVISDLAESHIDTWSSRYAEYTRKSQVSFDLNVNHDISLEVDAIEQMIERELLENEFSYLEHTFIKEVLKKINLKELKLKRYE